MESGLIRDPAVPAGCSLPAVPITVAARETRMYLRFDPPRPMALNCPLWERQQIVTGRFSCKRGAQCISIASITFPGAFTSAVPLEIRCTRCKVSLRDPMQPMEAKSAAPRLRHSPSAGRSTRPGRRGTHSLCGQTRPCYWVSLVEKEVRRFTLGDFFGVVWFICFLFVCLVVFVLFL